MDLAEYAECDATELRRLLAAAEVTAGEVHIVLHPLRSLLS